MNRLRALVILSLLLSSLWGGQAFAAAPDVANCNFVPREQGQDLLSSLPENVVGWANCRPAHLDTNIFIISKLEKAQSQDVAKYLLNFAHLIVASGQLHRVVKQKLSPTGSGEMLIETKRINDLEPMLHYAIVVQVPQATYVFVHTMGQQDFKLAASQLSRARLLLTGPQFLSHLK